jgi:hypothetical protein
MRISFYKTITMRNAVKIENIIKDISRATITIDSISKDYLINGVVPNEVPQDYYLNLYKEFESCIQLQITENCSSDLLQVFLKETNSGIQSLENIISHRKLNLLFDRRDNKITNGAEKTHVYINMMLKIKNRTLLNIKKLLENEIKYFGFNTSVDYNNFKETKESDNDILISEKTERATFNLGKKESLMFLFVLEKSGFLKFNNDAHRIEFIENNFNYTGQENNENKGKSLPMHTINSDLAKLKGSQNKTSNDRVFQKLLERLENDFFIYKF